MAESSRGRNVISEGVAGMLDNAFQVWRSDFVAVTLLSLVAYLPFGILAINYIYSIMMEIGGQIPFERVADTYAPLLALSLFWNGIWRGILIHYVANTIEAGRASMARSIVQGIRRMLPLAAIAGLSTLGLFFGCFAVFPFILVQAAVIAIPFVMIDNRSLNAALSATIVSANEQKLKFLKFHALYSCLIFIILLNCLVSLFFVLELAEVFLDLDESVLESELSLVNPLFLGTAFIAGLYLFEVMWALGGLFYYYDVTTRRSGADLMYEVSIIKKEIKSRELREGNA
ncbi:hypothetical protein ACFL54_03135 [Planctomycetota bacterium]